MTTRQQSQEQIFGEGLIIALKKCAQADAPLPAFEGPVERQTVASSVLRTCGLLFTCRLFYPHELHLPP